MGARSWLYILAITAIGCGGKDDDTGTTGTGDDDDDDGPVTIDCTVAPMYNLDSLSCEQLGSAFETTMNALAACNSDQDCRAVHPNCGDWNDVGCFYAANFCADGEWQEGHSVQTFNSAAAGCGDVSDQCGQGGNCGAAPELVCDNHRCDFAQ